MFAGSEQLGNGWLAIERLPTEPRSIAGEERFEGIRVGLAEEVFVIGGSVQGEAN